MPITNDDRRSQRRLNGRIATIARRLSTTAHEQETHFHNGPQAQPVPCFDASCPYPRLDAP
jgi:hypothetical protein